MKKGSRIRKGLLILLMALTALIVFGLIVMGLWNAILPQVLNVTPINLGQAIGLLVLSKILFSGFRYGGGWGGPRRSKWKQQMQEKWINMTPEEREKFKQSWKARCSTWKGPRDSRTETTDLPNHSK